MVRLLRDTGATFLSVEKTVYRFAVATVTNREEAFRLRWAPTPANDDLTETRRRIVAATTPGGPCAPLTPCGPGGPVAPVSPFAP